MFQNPSKHYQLTVVICNYWMWVVSRQSSVLIIISYTTKYSYFLIGISYGLNFLLNMVLVWQLRQSKGHVIFCYFQCALCYVQIIYERNFSFSFLFFFFKTMMCTCCVLSLCMSNGEIGFGNRVLVNPKQNTNGEFGRKKG